MLVTAPLTLWRGQGSSWHFSTVPPEQSVEIRAHGLATPRGFGSVPVAARIGEVRWRTSVFPQKAGGYLLPIKGEIRRRAAIGPGDEVRVELTLI